MTPTNSQVGRNTKIGEDEINLQIKRENTRCQAEHAVKNCTVFIIPSIHAVAFKAFKETNNMAV